MRIAIIPLALIILLGVSGIATASRNPGYYDQNSGGEAAKPRRGGYFFYQDPAPEDDPESFVERVTKPQKEQEPFTGQIPWDQVYDLHPDTFAQLLEDTLKWAVHKPEAERLQAYMTLQAVAIERSEKFEKAWASVLNSLPALDPTAYRPPTAIGTKLAVMSRDADLESYIADMRENMGILLFSRADCSYCAEQKKILTSFSEAWGWGNIQEIDILQHPEAAQEYGVSLVPDLFVVGKRGEEIYQKRLRAGLTTKSEIERAMREVYSTWFMGRPYMTDMEIQGQGAWRAHIESLAKESEKRKTGLDSFVEKYRKQREGK